MHKLAATVKQVSRGYKGIANGKWRLFSSSISNENDPSTSSLSLTIKPLPDSNVEFARMMANIKRSGGRKRARRRPRPFDERVLLEGRRLIADAILAGGKFSHIIVSDVTQLHDLPIADGEGQLFHISHDRMEAWSDLTTPPGIMGIFEKPTCDSVLTNRGLLPRLPITVVCDQIRDPSNMGAILRTAAAGRVDNVLVMDNCCDVYRSKILRSAMGAHFRVPIMPALDWETITTYLPDEFEMYIADNNSFELMSEAESYKLDSVDYLEGVDAENEEHTAIELTDSDAAELELTDAAERARLDRLADLRAVKLPILRYEHMDYSKDSHCVLVVGGESDGISGGAYELAHKVAAMRVHISMGNGVTCLNAATSVGIILFEMKRQLERAGRMVAADWPENIARQQVIGSSNQDGDSEMMVGTQRRRTTMIGSREDLVEHIAGNFHAPRINNVNN